MSDLLWQKTGVQVNARIMQFLAGDDVLLDREFVLHDIAASKAHVEGLARIGLLADDESKALMRELDLLGEDFSQGEFIVDERYEDGHSAIEARLSERLGDIGRKVHTGRSRNDQILVATRLWLKGKLAELSGLCAQIARVCLQRAASESLPLPGYTHLQRAVVSSTSMWLAGFAESFIDNAQRARQSLDWIDANPLGTAAGFGVNLKLDRQFTTTQLGFARMQVSPIAAQLSRGKFEMAALETLGSALLDLRRMAWDLSLFTTTEFGFVSVPAEYTTGSSIMPHKRNPDVFELMRGRSCVASAALNEVLGITQKLTSGYHRDLQLIKPPLFRGIDSCLQTLDILPGALAGVRFNPSNIRLDPGIHAAAAANALVAAENIPFREAYQRVAAALKDPK
jgi:argininosuccinate lyase